MVSGKLLNTISNRSSIAKRYQLSILIVFWKAIKNVLKSWIFQFDLIFRRAVVGHHCPRRRTLVRNNIHPFPLMFTEQRGYRSASSIIVYNVRTMGSAAWPDNPAPMVAFLGEQPATVVRPREPQAFAAVTNTPAAAVVGVVVVVVAGVVRGVLAVGALDRVQFVRIRVRGRRVRQLREEVAAVRVTRVIGRAPRRVRPEQLQQRGTACDPPDGHEPRRTSSSSSGPPGERVCADASRPEWRGAARTVLGRVTTPLAHNTVIGNSIVRQRYTNALGHKNESRFPRWRRAQLVRHTYITLRDTWCAESYWSHGVCAERWFRIGLYGFLRWTVERHRCYRGRNELLSC